LAYTLESEINKYKEIIHVLYGCETWSLTLREENKLRGDLDIDG